METYLIDAGIAVAAVALAAWTFRKDGRDARATQHSFDRHVDDALSIANQK